MHLYNCSIRQFTLERNNKNESFQKYYENEFRRYDKKDEDESDLETESSDEDIPEQVKKDILKLYQMYGITNHKMKNKDRFSQNNIDQQGFDLKLKQPSPQSKYMKIVLQNNHDIQQENQQSEQIKNFDQSKEQFSQKQGSSRDEHQENRNQNEFAQLAFVFFSTIYILKTYFKIDEIEQHLDIKNDRKNYYNYKYSFYTFLLLFSKQVCTVLFESSNKFTLNKAFSIICLFGIYPFFYHQKIRPIVLEVQNKKNEKEMKIAKLREIRRLQKKFNLEPTEESQNDKMQSQNDSSKKNI